MPRTRRGTGEPYCRRADDGAVDCWGAAVPEMSEAPVLSDEELDRLEALARRSPEATS